MGRTILYILICISVVVALAVLMLFTPIADATDEIAIIPETAEEVPAIAVPAEVEPIVPEGPAVSDLTEEPVAEPAEGITSSVITDIAYAIDGVIVTGEYPHKTTIAGVDIYWANDDQRLRIGLVAPGTGYVSIGLDPERQMEGANIIIAAMHAGELTIRDDYGHEPLAHIEDTVRGGQDNIIDAAGNEWPDQTVVEFIIPLDSGDAMDKPLVAGHEYTILVAYHSMLDSFSNRHTRRGSGLMQLDLP